MNYKIGLRLKHSSFFSDLIKWREWSILLVFQEFRYFGNHKDILTTNPTQNTVLYSRKRHTTLTSHLIHHTVSFLLLSIESCQVLARTK